MNVTREELESACATAREALLRERGARPHWVGQLSPSALSTATAVSALSAYDPAAQHERIVRGLAWLARTQNEDGGWGDTPRSRSNISTSFLVRAAFALAQSGDPAQLARCQAYLDRQGGIDALVARYGTDKTFSAPIMANLALAGLVPWSACPPLPFWLAALPRWSYPYLGLRVVSYALPALIAVGLAGFVRAGRRNPFHRLATARALEVLAQVTPESGGYLEATPLTSFVAMSLVAAGQREHPSLPKNIQFLCSEQSADGAWKIDRDLAIWLTTGSICALGEGDAIARDWLVEQQTRAPHPFVGSAPGCWGWTNSSGSVPDADDTAGAVLALKLMPGAEHATQSALTGLSWLLGLQNSDGGWPTFCRGWKKLPFDRSCADITAHVLRAIAAWAPPERQQWKVAFFMASKRGFDYLARTQRSDGSWAPLWFGNELAPNDENPVYGTARVLMAYRDVPAWLFGATDSAARGVAYLLAAQNADGSWGGAKGVPGSIEETALACDALSGFPEEPSELARQAGLAWLCRRIHENGLDEPAPIGLYFAKLWYFERLYPLIFAVSALRRGLYGVDIKAAPATMASGATRGEA